MSNYEKVKEWRKNNPEKLLEQATRYRNKHPETNIKAKAKYREGNLKEIRERDKIAQAKRRKQDPEGQRIRYERWRTKKEAELWNIAGRPRAEYCELCTESGLTVFDHCHDGGHFRGWICDRCNRVLGSVKDNVKLLKAMIDYLENDRGKINHKEAECIT
jgi:hypothetical protein